MSVHQLKDGRWIVKIPDPEKKSGSRREYFGRGLAAESKARVYDRSLDLKHTRPRIDNDGPLFCELSVVYMTNKSFTPGNYRRTQISLTSTINPVIGNTPAAGITYSDLDKYVNRRRQEVKNNTIRREISVIQAVLNWAAQRRPPMIPMNPVKGFSPPPADDAVILPPTIAEVMAILDHCNPRLRRFILLSFYTGARPGAVEILSLNWDSVLWDQSVIRIISAKKGGIAMREVPIKPKFLAILKQWYAHDRQKENVTASNSIIRYRGKPIIRMDHAWNEAKKNAGIPKERRLRMYDLRHFFVTSAIESGADYKTLSEVVGSNPETLRRYYQHVSSAARVKLIENMPELPDNFW